MQDRAHVTYPRESPHVTGDCWSRECEPLVYMFQKQRIWICRESKDTDSVQAGSTIKGSGLSIC